MKHIFLRYILSTVLLLLGAAAMVFLGTDSYVAIGLLSTSVVLTASVAFTIIRYAIKARRQ